MLAFLIFQEENKLHWLYSMLCYGVVVLNLKKQIKKMYISVHTFPFGLITTM